MADDNYFKDRSDAAHRKQALTAGGIAIFASLATITATWWAKKNKSRNIAKTNDDLNECNAAIDAESPCISALVSADYCVLDSNVWMAPEAAALLHLLQKYAAECGGKVSVLSAQIAEIDRLKNPPKGSGVRHNEGKHGRARHAMRRMNEFRTAGLLQELDDTAIAAGRTHADDVFVDYFLRGVPEKASIRFVTDDNGLALKMMKVETARLGRYQTIDRDPLMSRADRLSLLLRRRRMLENDLQRLQGGAPLLPAPARHDA